MTEKTQNQTGQPTGTLGLRFKRDVAFWFATMLLFLTLTVLDYSGLIGPRDVARAQPSESVVGDTGSTLIAKGETAQTPTALSDPFQNIVSVSGSPVVKVVGTEGFWRIAQTADGVWWFLSPSGKLEWLNGVTTVQPFQLGRRTPGPHFVSTDYPGDINALVSGARDQAALSTWASKTWDRVRETGFKSVGAWSHPIFHDLPNTKTNANPNVRLDVRLDVPIARDLNAWAYVPRDQWRLYSPGWKTTVEEAIKRQVTVLRDSPNLIGYYTDNELDWNDSGAGPAYYFDHLAADDPNRLNVVAVIKRIWPDVASFNLAWNMSLTDYDELLRLEKLPHEPPAAYGQLFSAWLEQLATDYFRITTQIIREHDPNHLILGVRFRGFAPIEVARASRNFTDAQSINYYVGDAKLDGEMFEMMYEVSGQPIIITEYGFHALDGRSGNRNTFGFDAQVSDQRARADGYRIMTTNLARLPYVIGADWFQWADEPPSGRTFDGEDVNFGVMDIDDRPYEMLVRAIRETTPLLNESHGRSSSDLLDGVLRPPFKERPTAEFRHLKKAPKVNGELSDWSEETRLSGIRRSEVLGLDRSTIPLPNVFSGWREEGLYFGIEVFDNDIAGAPANGWWWTRDNIELFLSTRDVEADQNFYTPHEHQFFFVPIAFPGPDGVSGITGRWRRMGDGLKDNKIPDTLVQDATRVFPDRYVVEMFIPKEALHQFNPEKSPYLSFNLNIKNFQGALAYFWSASKEQQTQIRPGTWGRVFLRPNMDATVSGN